MLFNNEKELREYVLKKCAAAVEDAELKVHKVIDECLAGFYGEFEPEEYIRTGQLLHSLVKTNVAQSGNGVSAEVYFDASALNYATGEVPLKSGFYGYATWSGEQVLDVAMTSGRPHGGHAAGTAIWTSSMGKLKDIMKILERALRAQGIPFV